MKNSVKKHPGISTLTVIIIISSAVLMIAAVAAMTALDETQISLRQSKALEVFTAAEACVEEALVKLNGNHFYIGENLVIGNANCEITVNGSGGNNRTINISSSLDGLYTREIEADVNLDGDFKITNWREMVD